LAQRDDIGIARFIQPFAPLNKLGAEIAQMGDRPAKACKPQPQEHEQHF
jgi:hypothetical protein